MTVCKLEKPLRRFTLPSAVLFDLGNTLARYYSSDEFQPILERAVDSVIAELGARGVATVDRATALVAAGDRFERAVGEPFGSVAARDRAARGVEPRRRDRAVRRRRLAQARAADLPARRR